MGASANIKIQVTLRGIKNSSAFETFDRMAKMVYNLVALAVAHAELNEEASGDVLLHKLTQLEQTHGAEEDLLALKQKMGLAPAPAPAAPPVRVEAPLDQAEQDELARALAELEAEEQEQLRGGRQS
jgi:phage shock protein A